MGLPDFHSIRGSYTNIERGFDVTNIAVSSEVTIWEYIGYGETIEVNFSAYQDTVQLHDLDLIRLYIDDTLVNSEIIGRYLSGNHLPENSLIQGVQFTPYSYFQFNLARGIFFNKKLKVTYFMFNLGAIDLTVSWSIGEY